MKRSKRNRLAALLLAIVLVIQGLPLSAFADNALPSAAAISEESSLAESETPIESESSEESEPEKSEPPEESVPLVESMPEESKPLEESKSEEVDDAETEAHEIELFAGLARGGLARGNEVINVSSSGYNDQIVYLSNGNVEYGWKAKTAQTTGRTAYCVEQGVALNAGNNGGYGSSEVDSDLYRKMSLADYFGRVKRSGNALKNEFLTQLYIWELQGIAPTSMTSYGSWAPDVSMAEYTAYKDEITPKIAAYFDKPSFDGRTITLRPGQSTTLTDTQGSFQYYEDNPSLNRAGITATKSGNSLTLTATSSSTSDVVRYYFDVDQNFQRPVLYYDNPQTQDCITAGYSDPANITLNIRIEKLGDLKIVKTSEDGVVAGVKFRVVGGGYDWTATTNAKGEISSQGWPTQDANGKEYKYVVTEENVPGRYNTPASQTITFEPGKTTTVRFNNTLKKGDLKILKTSEDDVVAGLKIEVTGNGNTYTKTTDANGGIDHKDMRVLDKNNKKIVYTAKELNTPGRYVQPASQTFTLEPGKTTTIKFHNALKKGDLKILKTSEDNVVAGLKIEVTGDGNTYTKTTDANGGIDHKGMRVLDKNNKKIVYTAKELNTPGRYVQPASQTFTLEPGKTTTIRFSNILKTWQLSVTKTDAEAGVAQGDATLQGAEYGLYKAGKLIDTYTTDAAGQFTTKTYVCGDDYTLQEITPSNGYLLDPTVYPVGVKPGDTTIAINPTSKTVTEQIIKGKIAIVKHTDNGETQIETPEAGAEFDVYLKSAGSYANAKDTERDHIICDEEGYAQTKDLPYGVYMVEQTKSWDGRDLMPPFEVYIAQDGKVYRYIINNGYFEGFLKVIKKDAGTGNTIPYAGAGFQILDPDGDIVKMRLTYPTNIELDTFYTAADGTLITPQKLPYGIGYQLVEVQAPYGYVLDSTPVTFDIKQDLSETEDGIELVKVEKLNLPQMGQVTLTKTGEVLSGTTEADGTYQPVYAEQGLFGAEYDVIAAEDIITPDGTVRALAGQVVDTLHTGYNGAARSQSLHLGKYQAVETKAPEGFVLDSTPIEFELTYAGQEIELTETAIAASDARQKVEITLEKAMEQDEKYHAGMNGEILDVQFGLYAAEDITAKDGTVIPADGLLETVTMKENGKQTFKTDLPFGKLYIQEIATNDKYIISDAKYPVTFAYQGQEIALVEITANDGKPIENTLKRGAVTLTKVDNELPDVKLSGAVFEVYQDVDGDGSYNPDSDRTIGEMKETDTGVYALEGLTAGQYLVAEKTAPEGFVGDTAYYPFEITKDGQLVTLETEPGKGFENRPIKGSVQLTKVDAENPENKLAGALFELYQDIDGDGKYTEKADKLYGKLAEEKDGLYHLDGLRYGKYLAVEKTAPEGFVRDTAYYPFEITEDGQLVTLETKPGKGFENQPIKGSVQGKKLSEDGKGLAGALIGLFPTDTTEYTEKTALMTALSADDGSFLFADVRFGQYKAKEISAPSGFKLSDEVIEVDITEDGQLVTVEIVNEAIPVVPLPQTGDTSNPVMLWTVLILAAVGAVASAVMLIKKKKKEKQEGKQED